MGLLIPGWTSGVLGMVLGALAALLIIVRTMKRSPWDIHDENSYQEHQGFSLDAVAAPLILFAALLTLLLGLGAIDQNIWPPFAVMGDVLGLLMLLFAIYRIAIGKA
jgi:hypothetical protein